MLILLTTSQTNLKLYKLKTMQNSWNHWLVIGEDSSRTGLPTPYSLLTIRIILNSWFENWPWNILKKSFLDCRSFWKVSKSSLWWCFSLEILLTVPVTGIAVLDKKERRSINLILMISHRNQDGALWWSLMHHVIRAW